MSVSAKTSGTQVVGDEQHRQIEAVAQVIAEIGVDEQYLFDLVADRIKDAVPGRWYGR
jgi:hypothetical protein